MHQESEKKTHFGNSEEVKIFTDLLSDNHPVFRIHKEPLHSTTKDKQPKLKIKKGFE